MGRMAERRPTLRWIRTTISTWFHIPTLNPVVMLRTQPMGYSTMTPTVIQPMRMVIYGEVVLNPTLLMNSQDDAHLIYEAGDTSGYPPCDDYSFMLPEHIL